MEHHELRRRNSFLCLVIGNVLCQTKNGSEVWTMNLTQDELWNTIDTLGWDVRNDNIVIEIGGTVVSGIVQPEGYNKKWASPLGHRKYNKDAFIVLKNLSRNDDTKSQPLDREHKPHHGTPTTATTTRDTPTEEGVSSDSSANTTE